MHSKDRHYKMMVSERDILMIEKKRLETEESKMNAVIRRNADEINMLTQELDRIRHPMYVPLDAAIVKYRKLHEQLIDIIQKLNESQLNILKEMEKLVPQSGKLENKLNSPGWFW